MIPRRLDLLAAAALLLVASTTGVCAQALSNVHIGDDAAALSKIVAQPSPPETVGHVTMRKLTFASANTLSATITDGGRVVYLEADWGGKPAGAASDFPGLRYGVTTLKDLSAKFGSNGIGFRRRPPTIPIPGGLALLNSYEVGGVIVTFVTKLAEAETAGVKPEDMQAFVGTHARLDAISLAATAFATQEWGETIYGPGYKKIEWK